MAALDWTSVRAEPKVAAVLVLLAIAGAARGETCEPDDSIRDARAVEAALVREEAVAAAATSTVARYSALCRAASYAFRIAEPENDRSSDLAARGVELADRARKLAPDRPEAHYRYAICLGIYLRENKLSGFTRVDELIAAAKKVIEIDERYERAGGHRLLALLYAEAPRFIGPGDHDKARKHAARLLALAGDIDRKSVV